MLDLDISATLGKIIGPKYGLTEQEFSTVRTMLGRYIPEWQRECDEGRHAWTQDLDQGDTVKQVTDAAKALKDTGIQTILWIGIGGSGLGPRVLQEVFETPQTIEFIIIDTVDPSALSLYGNIVDWQKTGIVIVSKSGETLESMSAFFHFYKQLTRAVGKKAPTRVIGITDPATGSLRSFCLREHIPLLSIPPEVGGRYCIFTPVGLLPLALLHADITQFIGGALDMRERCFTRVAADNPAALLAATQYLLDRKGYLIRVVMPYAARLQSLARWNQQLIAESLGKNDVLNPFPVAAVGTQDQHSLLQQWMQGPHKCWHLFLSEAEKETLIVPRDIPEEWHLIAGKTMGSVLDALFEGARAGLTHAKRPHVTIQMTSIDAYHMGQLFYLLLAEVVLLGKLYRIDPYGQPGVELSKTIAKDILRRGQ